VVGALAMYWLVRRTRWRFLFERPRWMSIAQASARPTLAASPRV